MLKVEFWQGRYDTGQMNWDLGGPSPHFAALLQSSPDFLRPGSMAVLGAGQGHDAALFAKAGFAVTGFDYALGAIERAEQLYGDLFGMVQANIFDLAKPDSEWAGQFDYVLEHTCFCAIFPQDRATYVRSVANILKPGGYLIGVFWEHGEPDGPPYNTTEADIREAFGVDFEVVSTKDVPPASDRSGVERLIVLQRKTQ